MTLDHPVLYSLLPVVLLIAIGVVAGKARLVRGEGVRDLSNLVFLVLTQALLFRTMSAVHIERLDFKSVALYYAVFAAGVRAPQSVDAMAMIYMAVTLVWLLIALRFVDPTQLVSRVKEHPRAE